MNLLLDTHVFLWWLDDHDRLGKIALKEIGNAENVVWVSAVVAWEIAIKVSLGRLQIEGDVQSRLPGELEYYDFRPLPISLQHALAVMDLPPHHGDPFDRLLIAQALTDGLRIVTADSKFSAYGTSILEADR